MTKPRLLAFDFHNAGSYHVGYSAFFMLWRIVVNPKNVIFVETTMWQ